MSKLTLTITCTLIAAILLTLAYGVVQWKIEATKNREKSKHYESLHGIYLSRLKQQPNQLAAIIGNSHVHRMNTNNISKDILNFGISGDKILGTRNRIKDYTATGKLSSVALLIGTNDLLEDVSMNELSERLNRLQDTLKPYAKVFWISPPPASPTRLPKKIQEQANAAIENSCAQLPNCQFISLASGGNAKLNKYLDRDGIHLTTQGYKYLASYIRPYIISPQVN